MVASAGASQPDDEITSTVACSSRVALSRTKSRSAAISRPASRREKWHCSNTARPRSAAGSASPAAAARRPRGGAPAARRTPRQS
eukprot:5640518-Pleurochrysis_carterae.AAC.1